MNIVKRGGIVVLLVFVLSVMLTGCMGQGSVTNSGWTVVAEDGGVVYTALATGTVLALDGATGDVLWNYPVATSSSSGGILSLFSRKTSDEETQSALDAVYGQPVVTDELVLIGSYNYGLYAFDRISGEKIWEFSAEGAIIGGPTLWDGIAYFGASDHKVYAVNAETGEVVWAQPFETANWVWGAPAVDESHVYVGSMDHSVYAIDRETGQEVWHTDIGASVPGSVTLADGRLFVGAVDRKLHVLDAATGQVLWERDLGHWVWGEALVEAGYVYVGSLDGKFHALAVTDGTPRWDAVQLEGAVRAGPALLDGDLIVGTDAGVVYRIVMADGTAQELYRRSSAKMLSKPAIAGHMVYLGTTVAEVIALDTANTSAPLVWVYPPPKQ